MGSTGGSRETHVAGKVTALVGGGTTAVGWSVCLNRGGRAGTGGRGATGRGAGRGLAGGGWACGPPREEATETSMSTASMHGGARHDGGRGVWSRGQRDGGTRRIERLRERIEIRSRLENPWTTPKLDPPVGLGNMDTRASAARRPHPFVARVRWGRATGPPHTGSVRRKNWTRRSPTRSPKSSAV